MPLLNEDDLRAKLASMGTAHMPTVLAKMLGAAILLLVIVFTVFFIAFVGRGVSTQETWGQFGDFIGGTLNPLFSFLSLIALVLTVALQARQLDLAHEQLENSRDELRATQDELKKSAEAQRASAAAQQEQAKYSVIAAQIDALRASLAVASESLSQAQAAGQLSGPDTYQRLLRRKEFLASEILRITDELCQRPGGV